MKARDINLPTGLDRVNALLAWRGMPKDCGPGAVDDQARRFQVLIIELHEAFDDASSRQLESLFAANDELAQLILDLFNGRQPPDLTVRSGILADRLRRLAAQAGLCADLAQKLHDCSLAMAGTADEEIVGPAVCQAWTLPRAAPDRPTGHAGKCGAALTERSASPWTP